MDTVNDLINEYLDARDKLKTLGIEPVAWAVKGQFEPLVYIKIGTRFKQAFLGWIDRHNNTCAVTLLHGMVNPSIYDLDYLHHCRIFKGETKRQTYMVPHKDIWRFEEAKLYADDDFRYEDLFLRSFGVYEHEVKK